MITAGLLSDQLSSAGLPVAGINVGWTGPQSEGPTYSYHTAPGGTLVRIVWNVVWTQAQWNQADAIVQGYTDTAALLAEQRATAAALVVAGDADYKLDRAIVILTVGQLNVLREALTTLLNAITANGATLASIVTTAKTIPAMPDITLAQAKTAIINNINSGSAD